MLDEYKNVFQGALDSLIKVVKISKSCSGNIKLIAKKFNNDQEAMELLGPLKEKYTKISLFFQEGVDILKGVNDVLEDENYLLIEYNFEEIFLSYNIALEIIKKEKLYLLINDNIQNVELTVKKIKKNIILSDEELDSFYKLFFHELLDNLEDYSHNSIKEKQGMKQMQKELIKIGNIRKINSIRKNIDIIINKINRKYNINIGNIEIVYNNDCSLIENYTSNINKMFACICNTLQIENCSVDLRCQKKDDEIVSLPYKEIQKEIMDYIDKCLDIKQKLAKKRQEETDNIYYLEMIKLECPNAFKINGQVLQDNTTSFKQLYQEMLAPEKLFNLYGDKCHLLGFDKSILEQYFVCNNIELNEETLNKCFKGLIYNYINAKILSFFQNDKLNDIILDIKEEYYSLLLNNNIDCFLLDTDEVLKKIIMDNLPIIISKVLNVPAIIISNNAMLNIKEFIDVYYKEVLHDCYSIDYFIYENIEDDGQYILYNRLLDSIDINDYHIFITLLKEMLLYKNNSDVKMEIIKCLQTYIMSLQKTKRENNYAQMLSYLSTLSLSNMDEFIGMNENDKATDNMDYYISNVSVLFSDISTIDLETLDASFRTKKELMDYLFFIKDGINYLVCRYNNINNIGLKSYMHEKYTDFYGVYKLKHSLLRATYGIFGSTIMLDDLFLRSDANKNSYRDKITKSNNKFKNSTFISDICQDWYYRLEVNIKIINIYKYVHDNNALTKEEVENDNMCMEMLINKFIIDILDNENISSDDKKNLLENLKLNLESFIGKEDNILARIKLKNE